MIKNEKWDERILNRKISNKEHPRKFDLEERLISFSLSVLEVIEQLPSTYTGQHFAIQLVRSGTSAALNYGEAQSAESRKDFIHKMKVALKELRESHICLIIIARKPLIRDQKRLDPVIEENDELIAIFVKSIATAQQKLNKK